MPISDEVKNKFLQKDFRDALTWLFVGAVAWEAAQKRPERCCHQIVLGMYTSLVQARALYDFFYNKARGRDDDARASCFAPAWKETGSALYLKYMSGEAPANKRVFHLVYEREKYAGGPGHDGPDHLNKQILGFAKDLHRLTEEFVGKVKAVFHGSVKFALEEALREAQQVADYYGIPNPFAN
jgi:hypothetical protein